KQLQGTWSLIPIPRTDPKEEWIFNDGTLYRKKGNNNGSAPVPFDTATYSVKTGLSSVKIKIENFKAVLDELNGTWDVVTLDNDILFIATDHDGTSGIMQREFQKKD
ncbi:MAG: hypothetical protein IT242_03340, partial [Bacteroidia bacterium]|nr:hypothetical protein [Bacteroidia bacterium]